MSDIAFCAALACGLVGSFYLWPNERRFALLCLKDLKKASEYGPQFVDRDDHSVVQKRLVSFLTCTFLNVLLLEYIWRNEADDKRVIWGSVFVYHLLCSEGTFGGSIKVVLGSFIGTLALFSGVIFERGGICWHYFREDPILVLRSIICPFGEELLFRATFLNLLQHRRSVSSSIILSSVIFTFSHTHLVFSLVTDEYRNRIMSGETKPSIITCWGRAVQKLCVLFLCTFACGLLCGYYFTTICRNNILAVFLSHLLCNLMGPPTLAFMQETSRKKRFTGVIAYGGGIMGWVAIVSSLKSW
ncbi:CAAX prenyl protease 2 [Trypanosoma melophagium]|uniref:CAAX prenyl protease 2 n=1 Tax=Trypanosoma melophagium TaxID=715481 RepID=UPI00351A0EEE|nr:CAAX prenyl protease 2 [Trypanosoma melophagium]